MTVVPPKKKEGYREHVVKMTFFEEIFSGDPEATADLTMIIVVVVIVILMYRSKKKKQKEKDIDKEL